MQNIKEKRKLILTFNTKKNISLSMQPSNCPTCQKPLTYIPQNNTWHCYNCQKYIAVGKKRIGLWDILIILEIIIIIIIIAYWFMKR